MASPFSRMEFMRLLYNDYMSFPDDGYPDDGDDLYPLSTDFAGYINNKSTFVCPDDQDTTSTGNFASYDPYYVARNGPYDTDELAIGCPRHRGGNCSTSSFSSRVENWRSSYRLKFVFTVSHPFVCECHNITTIPNYQLPLVKPCMRFSRTRLSDSFHLKHSQIVNQTHISWGQLVRIY
ncbi:MAG: hypothetical protein MAG551_01023 [Candidatus Scalindua arabica]|uniref:Uncharacterized protein n=1 Tax=Candidatus Scalindua arabica TaxID=1127984 RepID=A0A942A0C4_9BACT|nr:hypothetical protein [Candidatus Scalindua arabica]